MAPASRTGLNTPPGLTGPLLDAVQQTADGVWVPASFLRALDGNGDLVDLRADASGRLQVDTAASAQSLTSKVLTTTTATGDLSAQGTGELIVDCSGMNTCSFRKAAGSGTLQFEVSMDGTNYDALICARADANGNNSAASGATTSMETWEGAIPAGASRLRCRASVVATSVTVRIGLSTAAYEPAPTVTISGTPQVQLASSNTHIGGTNANVIWYDDTTATLAGAATYTGTGRDVTAGVAGTIINAGGTLPKEVRGLAVADVAGTLYLEVSRDNTTFRRIAAVPTSSPVAGTFTAELQFLPATRYYRWVYVNGAGAQTHFMLQTMQLGA